VVTLMVVMVNEAFEFLFQLPWCVVVLERDHALRTTYCTLVIESGAQTSRKR
jgi:hypothetical protein